MYSIYDDPQTYCEFTKVSITIRLNVPYFRTIRLININMRSIFTTTVKLIKAFFTTYCPENNSPQNSSWKPNQDYQQSNGFQLQNMNQHNISNKLENHLEQIIIN